jgi:hypothetical protein
MVTASNYLEYDLWLHGDPTIWSSPYRSKNAWHRLHRNDCCCGSSDFASRAAGSARGPAGGLEE